MGPSRLTDSAKTKNHENLTFDQLHSRVEACGDRSLAVLIQPSLVHLRDKCKAIRLHRNKRLAHLDLQTALGVSRKRPPRVSRKTINEALWTASEYLHTIETHYCNSATHHEPLMVDRGADGLVATHRLGLRYDGIYKQKHIPWNNMSNSRWNDS